MADEMRTAQMTPQWVMAYLRSSGLEHFQPVSGREEELRCGLLQEPLVDILMRQQAREQDASFKALDTGNRVLIRNSVNMQWTEVVIRFSDEEVRGMDRAAFRGHVYERLGAAATALMAAWEQQHGEQP